ncbi:MAG: replicative DNA helicase, partial [Acidobacteria bacterium]|nr:replicative DNA helicase [Acidobacteriota bacterium]
MKTDIALEKSLPHNSEAERAVLGAILLDNALFDQTSEILTTGDFYLESHRSIFSTMERLASDSRAIDSLTLRDELQKENTLEAVGGVAYVASLLDGVPRVSSVEHYARIVQEKSLLRKLIHAANEILLRGISNEEDPLELLERAEKSIFAISQEKIKSGFVQLQDLLTESYENIEALYQRKELITGLSTGFVDLDRLTSGFQPSDLIIVAARPGLGKTSLVLNIAQYSAIQHQKV